MVPTITSFDSKHVAAELCYRECGWWGLHGRVAYDLAAGTVTLEEAISPP